MAHSMPTRSSAFATSSACGPPRRFERHRVTPGGDDCLILPRNSAPGLRKAARNRGPRTPEPRRALTYGANVLGLQTLGALLHIELHSLPLSEATKAISLDRGVVAKNVLATFLLNEA